MRALSLICGLLFATAALLAEPGGVLFTEEAQELGLDFVYANGMSGELYYPEIVGGGVALFDYDNDGDLDVYLVQGGSLAAGEERPRDRLLRNDLGGKRFVDVTAAAGIVARGYGGGVAAGDYDNDGDVDLYVTNFGPNQLWRNNGEGTFSDVTAEAGADDSRWSVPAVFFDYDGDGWLDLWIGNYVDFSVVTRRKCFSDSGARDYCKPLVYKAVPDRLLRNRGGTFEDVTAASGLDQAYGRALGAVTADFNGDRRLDLYVANDLSENQLWLQQADGTFIDDALLAGCALNREGQPEGSMGVDAQDFDRDGDEDLFMVHTVRETHTLYLNDGSGMFSDVTFERGLAATTYPYTGFGTAWLDVENDGELDLLVANGAVEAIESQQRAREPFPYRQRNQLLRHRGGGVYEDASDDAGPAFALAEVSRGAAFGDLDNDGDTDVVVTNIEAPAHLYVNRTEPLGHWLGVRLLNVRDQLGGRFTLRRGAEPSRWWRIRTEGSYASSHDPRRLVGLGESTDPGELVIEWPDGLVSHWQGLPIDTWINVRRPATKPNSATRKP